MSFRLPTQVTIASGCIRRIAEVVATFSCRRILLVIDEGLRITAWPDVILGALEDTGLEVHVEDQIEQNPRHSTIDEIAGKARGLEIELVIGLGGGSVLDAAKAVAMLLRNPGSCVQYEGKNLFENGSVPFIAVPTTCGTGSEVTWVSVISHPAELRKLSVKGDAMFPDVALVDPDVLTTLPDRLIAYTGMDALTHALEAYTVVCHNPVSDALAEKAIALLFQYLPRVVIDREDEEARFEVMRASTLAGMAFGNADVGGVHCLSETIGGIWDVPHGLANAILLVPVMRYHQPVIQKRLAALARCLDLVEAEDAAVGVLSDAMINRIQELVNELDIPAFSSLGINEEEYHRIAAGAVENNSNSSNPQLMDAPAYLEILMGLSRQS
ncbi:MAG: iron-containing alcohol dehydrogenase family protein [Rhodothermales bacterium]